LVLSQGFEQSIGRSGKGRVRAAAASADLFPECLRTQRLQIGSRGESWRQKRHGRFARPRTDLSIPAAAVGSVVAVKTY